MGERRRVKRPFANASSTLATSTMDNSFLDENDYLDYVGNLERQWQQNLHDTTKFSPRQWLEHFPEMTTRCQGLLIEALDEVARIKNQMETQTRANTTTDPVKHLINESWIEVVLGAKLDQAQRRVNWLRRATRAYAPDKLKTGIDEDDVTTARLVPIDSIMTSKPRRSHGRLFYCCPYHQEKSPSFCVFADNKFRCFGCGANGDVIDLTMKLEKIDFVAAVKLLLAK